MHEKGFSPLKTLMDGFIEASRTIYVCSLYHKKQHLDEDNLIEGATIVGRAKVIEFLSQGTASITY